MKEKIYKTKKDIMDAFLLILKTKEIEKITIKEITNLSGHNRSTFYVYYNDVYDLLEQAEDELINKICFAINELMTINKNISTDTIINSFLSVYVEDKIMLSTLFTSNSSNFLYKYKKIIKNKFLNQMIVTEENKVKLDYLIEYQVSAVISCIIHWIKSDEQISANDLLKLLQTYSVNGFYNIFIQNSKN